jgi:hypothetical protein
MRQEEYTSVAQLKIVGLQKYKYPQFLEPIPLHHSSWIIAIMHSKIWRMNNYCAVLMDPEAIVFTEGGLLSRKATR